MVYDTSIRTPEEERLFKERQQRIIAQMNELDYRPGEDKPETTLDANDIASVIMGGGVRRK